MNFKGKDWTEIAIYFGIIDDGYQGGVEEDIIAIKKTQEFLYSSMMSENEKEVANVLRSFLSKFLVHSKEVQSSYPLWRGLNEIDMDTNLIKYCAVLLPHLWI